MDDVRERDHPPGDAEGRPATHGRLPALGEPPEDEQDDGSKVPGSQGGPDPGGRAGPRRADAGRRRQREWRPRPCPGRVVDPEYLDVRLDPRTDFVHPVKPDPTVFAYLLEGRASLGGAACDLI